MTKAKKYSRKQALSHTLREHIRAESGQLFDAEQVQPTSSELSEAGRWHTETRRLSEAGHPETGSGQLSKVELIKAGSRQLRGTLSEALADGYTYFSEDYIQLVKFHGVYQQDDRHLRKALRQQGRERHYMMMIRARIPGGILDASQYLAFDQLADQYGNGTLRITTRRTFQLYGVQKGDLKETIRSIDDALITTLGGCGDQVRNIVCCSVPHHGAFFAAVRRDLLALVDRLSAKTAAYHEIWLDGEKVNTAREESGATVEEEPLYRDVYLPRKFKLAIACEGDNCVDVCAIDLGIVSHRASDDGVSGAADMRTGHRRVGTRISRSTPRVRDGVR